MDNPRETAANAELGFAELGFVGLGNMGEPMVRQLLASGYIVRVYDANPEAAAKLEDTGAETASNLRELAAASEVVLLSLPESSIVEEVVLGEGGLIGGLREGSVLIDTSSSQPSSTRMISSRLSEAGIEMLDAPVSGGVLRAEEGDLSVMVGGRSEVFERRRPVLESFGSKVFHVGESGNGHLVKSLNNLISAMTLASASEAVLLAERSGVSPELFIDVVNASNGRSYSTEVKFPRYILNSAYEDGFALSLMVKDLKIALQTAAEMGFPMHLGSTLAQLWQTAEAQGRGAEGHTAIHAFLEELTGEDRRGRT